MRYAIYNDSGEILRVVSCPASVIAANVHDGEDFVPLPEGDDSSHKVVNGKAVPKVA